MNNPMRRLHRIRRGCRPIMCWLLLGIGVGLIMLHWAAAASEHTLQVLGNGNLGISVDAHGRVLSARWPQVGHFEQLGTALRVYALEGQAEAAYGAGWRLYDGARYHLPDDYQVTPTPGEPVLRARMRWEAAGVTVQRLLFVTPPEAGQADQLVDQVRVLEAGEADAYQLAWRYAYQPDGVVTPEFPGGIGLWSEPGEAGLLYQGLDAWLLGYVPEPEERLPWERFVALEAPDLEAMQRLGRGIWIAARTEPPPRVVLRPGQGAPLTESEPLIQPLEPLDLHFPVTPEATMSVHTRFGENLSQITAEQADAQAADVTALLDATWAYWEGLHAHREAQLALADEAENGVDYQETLRRVARMALTLHRDRVGNAVVAYQAHPAPHYSATPELGAWAAYAFAADQQYYESLGVIAFWREQLRREPQRGAPAGSMPVAVYSNGEPAAPRVWLQMRGTAWWVAAVRHVHRLLPETEQAALLEANRAALMLAGDFLAERLHPTTGEPVPEFDMALRRDRQHIASGLLQYVGLLSAIALLEEDGRAVPALWRESLADLETYLAFERLNQQEPWALDAALPFWLDGLLPRTDRLWEAQVAAENGWLPMQALAQRPMPILEDAALFALHTEPKTAAQVLLRWGGLSPLAGVD